MNNRLAKYLAHPVEQAASDMLLSDALRRCGVPEWEYEALRRHANEVLHDQCHTDEAERRN